MADEIIMEVWKIKDEISKECRGDVKILAERLRKRQRSPTQVVVNLERQRSEPQL